MLKTKKEELKKELEEKKELMNLRLKSLEKQEQLTREKLLKLRDEILNTVK
jgi:chaperonin cofactor prefoldin